MAERPLVFRWPRIYPGLPNYGFSGDDLYEPTPEQIKDRGPRPGLFYRPRKGVTVSQISKVAYGAENTRKGVFVISGSRWNHHARYSSKGFENYGIEGPQLVPKYDPNIATSEHNTGTGYPVLWIPPLDSKAEPETLFGPKPAPAPAPGQPIPGPIGPRGPRGEPGQRGATGKTGRAPTPAEISKSVAAYMTQNPAPTGPRGKTGKTGQPGQPGEPGQPGPIGPRGSAGQATEAAIRAEVKRYLQENPAAAGTQGPAGAPGRAPTPAEISKSVASYMVQNPAPAGQRGPQGEPGQPGRSGGTPTKAQIAAAVDAYLIEHPPAATLSDEQIAAAVAKFFAAHPPPSASISDEQIAAAVARWMDAHPAAVARPPSGTKKEGSGVLGLSLFSLAARLFSS